MRMITLTIDFGTRDWFVGTMKAVVLGINPRAIIVDITHEIPPGDIRAGAFSLMTACRYFPKGTVHVAVVGPAWAANAGPLPCKLQITFLLARIMACSRGRWPAKKSK